MARFSDEAWEYIQDCKEKKILGHSARKKKVQSRRGGMKTASDYMTSKELRALSSEVKTYRMGSPMKWDEFSEMPDDLKKMYIKNLRKKFNVPDEELAAAMGVDIQKFDKCLETIRLGRLNGLTCSYSNPDGYNWYDTDDNGRFQTWWVVAEEEN